ncbi:nitrite reductase large subunit NirB [Phytomonospora endophytica]|uniref:assimilatory sulfite reductase (ferredoxin) n=1 Tax=Phytomonospora endophytica TaxID=714109 RepID=A0A841FBK9_9ACTN|nr:nitrite reductase large subunit NirB [Phytomonospora endophytica]MBB6033174.1 nitrite reductase (NADH) large subunit [Phytomonospora endophytica]GIG65401.1 nitrite reductase large subunit [Phytomonospora endophytica]
MSGLGGAGAASKRVVVCGDGMVGRRFTEELRRRDPSARITVLAEESRPAYDRVRLSAFFDGASAEDLRLGEPDPGVDLRLGEPARRIDRDRRIVHGDHGSYEYDHLVLATGSSPFVPPIPGADAPGCFVYRTLDDLEALRAFAEGRRHGVVVGGGLLGLEAANALLLLGLDAEVVEFAPHLMPAQLDAAGGAVLRDHITRLGIGVHCGTAVAAVIPGPRLSLKTSDGGELTTDLVVFAAGIRPRDALAREAGLGVGERGGVLVDASCRTSDPAIWAVGECAAVEGVCFGLVAPGYAMAEVAAEGIAGGTAVFPGADTATKLKLLGVDVASFGVREGPLEANYLDPAEGVYARLVLSDDASTLLGGILVGDADAYPVLRAAVGGPVPGRLADLLAKDGGEGRELPGSAQICSCNAVTKDTITGAIADGHDDVTALKKCTRAGTTCGSCVPLLKRLLDESGVEQAKALCEHFAHSRAELFDIVRVRRITTFSELIAGHGTGRGCDVCKPVAASILASLHNGHVLEAERASLQDTNDHFLANLQRDGSYSVVPRVPGGEITPEKLIVIGEVARDFDLYTKITGGQRIDLLGARVDQLPLIWRRLVDAGFESGHAYGKALRTVKSCVGTTWCRYGVQDSVRLAVDLELRYRGLRSPHKIKAGVSGCARECAEARGKDFGVIATENGWNLYLGGNGGFTPRHARLFASDVDTETLVRLIDRFLMFYVRTADRLQRTAAWIEALDGGLDYLREVIVDDAIGVCAELDAAMERHVESYADEWAGVLDDPVKLARFASFVNAPETPDPSIRFIRERGQPVPESRTSPVLLGIPAVRS